MSFILLDLYLVLLVIMSIYGFYIYEIITIYVFILLLLLGGIDYSPHARMGTPTHRSELSIANSTQSFSNQLNI